MFCVSRVREFPAVVEHPEEVANDREALQVYVDRMAPLVVGQFVHPDATFRLGSSPFVLTSLLTGNCNLNLDHHRAA